MLSRWARIGAPCMQIGPIEKKRFTTTHVTDERTGATKQYDWSADDLIDARAWHRAITAALSAAADQPPLTSKLL